MSTCAFTVCVSVKTGVKITVNFYVKIDVNFAVKAVNFYTVNFYSVNFRAVIFYDFSAFWGWKCWRIFLAVLDNGGRLTPVFSATSVFVASGCSVRYASTLSFFT